MDLPRGRGRGRGAPAAPQQQQPPPTQPTATSSDGWPKGPPPPTSSWAVATGRAPAPSAWAQASRPSAPTAAWPSGSALPPGPAGDVAKIAGQVSQMSIAGAASGRGAGAPPRQQGTSTAPDVRGGASGLNKRPRRMLFTEEDILGAAMPAERTGKSGQRVKVTTNYVTFKSLPMSLKFVMYDTTFSPEVKAKFVPDRVRMMREMQNSGLLPKGPIAFDGRRVFTGMSLSDQETFLVKVDNPQFSSGPNAAISFRKIVDILPGSDQWFQVVNVIFNMCQQLLGQKKHGLDFFVPPSSDVKKITFDDPNVESFMPRRFNLRDSFELLQGYSVTLHRSLVNNNPFPMMLAGGTHRLANLNTALTEFDKSGPRAKVNLPGRTVLTRHNNKNYSIVDVIDNVDIDDTFEVRGQQMSYRNYFMTRYGAELTRKKQPFLKCKPPRVDRIKRMRILREKGLPVPDKDAPENDIKIPAELCYLTGFSEQEKATFQRDRDFNSMCRKAPEQRVSDVSRFCHFITSKPETKDMLTEWKIEVVPQPLTIDARVLDSCFMPNQRFRQSASLNARAIRAQKPANRPDNIIRLAVIQGGPRIQANMVNTYFEALQREAQGMGFVLEWPSRQMLTGGSLSERILQAKGQGADMVMIPLDDQNRYKEIKTTAIEQGVLTQVVRQQTVGKTMTAQKVALQMACKMGFTPWKVSYGLPNGGNDFMIVGIDTFVGKGSSAVQASVFSLDRDCSQYYTFVQYLQGRNMELHGNMAVAMKEALTAYRRRNNKFPSRIYLYRDGVGDSQLLNVKETEVKELNTFLSESYGNQPYHFVYTVVKKRISQRFFLMAGGVKNVTPGTVVDQMICKPKWLEYYIVPQEAGQGTATPTNFNVIHNNQTNPTDKLYVPMDDLQKTTFALTHLYFNWTGTIRVPAPVQYAHKCAFLLGQCAINSAVHSNIRENLFYL